MIIREFFQFYFQAVEPEVRDLYLGLIPGASNPAEEFSARFQRSDPGVLDFLLEFYELGRRLVQENPGQAILFNVAGNVCFEFFCSYIFREMKPADRQKVEERTGVSSTREIIDSLKGDVRLRNWFRGAIGRYLDENQLFAFSEVIALQNFSSGGELSFLTYALPIIKSQSSPVFDAGCGSGFASVIMSQYRPVCGMDVSRVRLARARAMHKALLQGDISIVKRLFELIQLELGGLSVNGSFPKGEDVVRSSGYPVEFVEWQLESLPFYSAEFGCINCLDVLEHTCEPARIIAEMARICKRGARVLVTAPTAFGELQQMIYESIEGTMFPAMLHLHHFDRDRLRRLFAAYDFKEQQVVEFDYIDGSELLQLVQRAPEPDLQSIVEKRIAGREASQIFAVFERM